MTIPKHQASDERPIAAVAADWRSPYDIEDRSAVEAFIDRHPFLTSLLERAPAAIQARFGPHAGLRLEVLADPDAEGAEHLYLFIRTGDDFEDVLRRRGRLDDEWWLDAMLDARGHMTLDVEFA